MKYIGEMQKTFSKLILNPKYHHRYLPLGAGGHVEEQVGGAHHVGGGVVHLVRNKCSLLNISSQIQWNHFLATRYSSLLCKLSK